MESSHGQAPFYFQYSVSPTEDNPLYSSARGCIVTLIVFADSGEKARERAGKYIVEKGWRITEVKRIQLLQPAQIEQMNPILKNIYQQAEQLGIGAIFDHW